MQIHYGKRFLRQFQKLPSKKQLRVKAALRLLLEDSDAPTLRRHQLHGEWHEHYSISAGGDMRLHYKQITADTIMFMAVGTHSQLYK
jgi:addiction module RelE/StbE family toxin